MAESSARAFFPRGEQRHFLKNVEKKIPIAEMVRICKCSPRTIRDWRNERFSMNLNCLRRLCHRLQWPIPESIKIRPQYWYVQKGAAKGGRSVIEKYGHVGGSSSYRKERRRLWWDTIGKFRSHPAVTAPLSVRTPRYSRKSAEFVGIVLGDGGLSPYQLTITLHKKDDREYGVFVERIIRELFDVPVTQIDDAQENVTTYLVSRVALVRLCAEKFGVFPGNKVKRQASIPKWIRNRPEYANACLRGLVDTDGSIYTHCYWVNQKQYCYKKMSFTSRSLPLLDFVHETLRLNGLHPRRTNKSEIRLDKTSDIQSYFTVIGTHNPKHLRRYRN